MTGVDMAAATARAATRALAVLVVLLGLLAMHGLAGTHHVSAATTAAQHAAAQHAAAQHRAALDDETGHQHGAVPAVAQDAVASADPARPGCDDDCAALAVLCAAVLTGAVLVIVLARRRRAALPTSPVRHGTATRAPPVRLASGPNPVKELCVSRT